jgi:hypothetical protein
MAAFRSPAGMERVLNFWTKGTSRVHGVLESHIDPGIRDKDLPE